MTLAARIDAVLPQTQCTRCGFAACLPYAEALAAGTASANLCEPGGAALVPVLAQLAGLPLLPPAQPDLPLQLAWIREADCIGCARCLPACPVDAILGARRLSHTVITQDCTGCGLCLPPCPVDCIELRAPPAGWQAPSADTNRARFGAHLERLARRAAARAARQTAGASALPDPATAVGAAGTGDGERVAVTDGTPAAGAVTLPSMAERRAAMIALARAAAAARRSAG